MSRRGAQVRSVHQIGSSKAAAPLPARHLVAYFARILARTSRLGARCIMWYIDLSRFWFSRHAVTERCLRSRLARRATCQSQQILGHYRGRMICIPVSSDRDLRWARHGSGHSERLRYHGGMNEGPRLRSIVGRTKAARRLEDYPATEAPPSAKAQRLATVCWPVSGWHLFTCRDPERHTCSDFGGSIAWFAEQLSVSLKNGSTATEIGADDERNWKWDEFGRCSMAGINQRIYEAAETRGSSPCCSRKTRAPRSVVARRHAAPKRCAWWLFGRVIGSARKWRVWSRADR